MERSDSESTLDEIELFGVLMHEYVRAPTNLNFTARVTRCSACTDCTTPVK